MDMNRLENNKFELYKDLFDIKEVVNDVCDIMRSQTDLKKLELILNFSQRVPKKVYSDSKRIKQVLFNLIGDASKFTFKGAITLDIDFEEDSKRLKVSVSDTGVGI